MDDDVARLHPVHFPTWDAIFFSRIYIFISNHWWRNIHPFVCITREKFDFAKQNISQITFSNKCIFFFLYLNRLNFAQCSYYPPFHSHRHWYLHNTPMWNSFFILYFLTAEVIPEEQAKTATKEIKMKAKENSIHHTYLSSPAERKKNLLPNPIVALTNKKKRRQKIDLVSSARAKNEAVAVAAVSEHSWFSTVHRTDKSSKIQFKKNKRKGGKAFGSYLPAE